MTVVLGSFNMVALVVAVGGAAKLASPDAFAVTARALGLPVGRWGARTVGAAELALGGVAIAVGGTVVAVALAVTYAGFAVVVLAARRAEATSCGCFGAVSAPPSIVHVVVDLASGVIAAVAAAAGPVPALGVTLSSQPLAGVPYVMAVATGALLILAADTVGAELFDAVASLGAVRSS